MDAWLPELDVAELADLKRVAARDAGLDAVGIAPATPFTSARARPRGAQGGRTPRRHAVHVPQPGSVDRPATRAARRPGHRGRRPSLPARPRRSVPPAPPSARGSPPTRGPITTSRSAPRSSAVAAPCTPPGWRTRVLVDDNALVDREAAHRAGLGWFGKNTNVLVPGLGSWVVLGCVVTDAPLPPDRGPVADGCGAVHPLPPRAARPARWSRPGVLDARRCLAWLLRGARGLPARVPRRAGRPHLRLRRLPGGVPAQPAAERHATAAGARRRRKPWVDVVAMLELDDAALLARFGRWYIAGRDPRYLRRNALVVLGNVGDGRRRRDVAPRPAPLRWRRRRAAPRARRLGGGQARLARTAAG